MAYFKIRNNTLNLGKRHPRFNTTQVIDYKGQLQEKSVSVNSGAEIIIEGDYLPVSAQKLRTEGLITVQEIDQNSYQKLVNAKEAVLQQEKLLIENSESAKNSNDSDDKNKRFNNKTKIR